MDSYAWEQRMIRSIVIISTLVCDSFFVQADQKPTLTIKDIHGKLQTPLLARGMKPSVLFFITHDCPVANKLAPEIRRIIEGYRAKAQFTLVYADPDMTAAEVTTHQKDYNYTKLNTIHDRQHKLVQATGATITPEVVLTKSNGHIVYRGRINNFYEDFGKPRRVITQHDLRDALDALLAGKPVPKPRGKCIGCFIPKLK